MSPELVSIILLGLGCAANPWGIMIAILLLDARRGHGIVWTYAARLAERDHRRPRGPPRRLPHRVRTRLRQREHRGVPGRAGPRPRPARPRGHATPATPRWLRAIENSTYLTAFLLGIYSATYPLVIAAAGEILRANTSTRETLALATLFVILGSSTVVLVAALRTFAPGRSAAFLDRMHAWLTSHNRAVITTILLVLGISLTARGLGGLF